MNFADRVKDTTTSTGTGSITLSGTAPAGFQTFGAAFTTGVQVPYGIADQSGSNWEIGIGTLTASTMLARTTVLASSNAGALVNFGAGTKDVYCTLPAAQVAQFQTSGNIAFNATVPLTVNGTQYMPPQTVASVIAFTPAANPVQGAGVYVRLTADGTNVPTFAGFTEWGGSMGYDNRNGVVNVVQFFYDGVTKWYSIAQQVGAQALASALTMTGPTSGTVSVASTAFTVTLSPVGAGVSGTVTVTPSDNGGGGSFSPSSVSLTTASASASFTYTPNATAGAKTISVTNNGGLTNPASITYTTSAAATSSNVRFANLVNMTESGTDPYTYTGGGVNFGTAMGGVATKSRVVGTDGSVSIVLPNADAASGTNQIMLALTSNTSPVAYSSLEYAVYGSSTYQSVGSVSGTANNSVAPAAGDVLRMRWVGTTLYFEVSKDGGATFPAQYLVRTFTGINANAIYPQVQASQSGVLRAGPATGIS